MTARTDFIAGARAIAPILLGIIPFALIAGVTAVNAGLSTVQAVAMSVIVFAGAAQLAAIDLIGRNASLVVIVLTAIIINLRFMMYSASISPYFREFNRPVKWFGAYVLTDQAYAVSVTEFRETHSDERSRKWFYFGAAVTFWVTWQISALIGTVLGSSVPEGLSLEFAVPLTFMALLFPSLDDHPTEIAALVAGGVGILVASLPFNLGLMVAALAGIAVGVAVEVRQGRFPSLENAPDDEVRAVDGGDGA